MLRFEQERPIRAGPVLAFCGTSADTVPACRQEIVEMLVHQRSVRTELPRFAEHWFAPLLEQFSQRFLEPAGTPDGFPCVFAQNAFRRRNVVFSLVPLRRGHHDFRELADDLSDYLDAGRDWDGSANTSEPLLAVFEPDAGLRTATGYSRLFDAALQYLIDHDPDPWPSHTHTDPASPFWSMCFRSTQVFVNVSHPLHANRRSRNLCDALVLVINPRERFDRVAGDHEKGHAVRAQIRHNVDLYDRQPRSPLLDHYLSGGLEWPQYDLPDDNATPARRCPFRFRAGDAAPAPETHLLPPPGEWAAIPASQLRFAC